MEKTMEKIVALAKARGFVYPGSEIYGGLANTWDYGNLGVELKNNVKKAWWQKFVQESPYNVGVDCAILMNPCNDLCFKISFFHNPLRSADGILTACRIRLLLTFYCSPL
jgi:glycyl-tRNA synthetase